MKLGPGRGPLLLLPLQLSSWVRPALNGSETTVQQEGDGVLQLLGLPGHRPVRRAAPASLPPAPAHTTPGTAHQPGPSLWRCQVQGRHLPASQGAQRPRPHTCGSSNQMVRGLSAEP